MSPIIVQREDLVCSLAVLWGGVLNGAIRLRQTYSFIAELAAQAAKSFPPLMKVYQTES